MVKSRLNSDSPVVGSGFRTAEEMRDECWRINQRMKRIDADRWYWVSQRQGIWRMELVEGPDVAAIWTILDDKPMVPPGWVEYRFRKWHGQLIAMMQRGVTFNEMEDWATPERKEARAKYVATEVRILREQYPHLYEGELL